MHRWSSAQVCESHFFANHRRRDMGRQEKHLPVEPNPTLIPGRTSFMPILTSF